MKEYLVTEVGYPKDEIGIIISATSKNQRIAIQNDFNKGKIKVIIGSEAYSEGMNSTGKHFRFISSSLPIISLASAR